MPLIELKTNLRNLKFTKNRVSDRGIILPGDTTSKVTNKPTQYKTLKFQGDTPGYGSSGQPFIQLPISGEGNSQSVKNLYTAARTSIDFPIRGGGIDYDSQSQTFTVFSQLDKQRIKAFLESKPRGAAFIQKQIGLQMSNPNTQTGTTFAGDTANLIIPSNLQNTKVYNSKNTLAQIGLSGTGLHATRIGNIPIDVRAKYYSDVVGFERNMSNEQVQSKNRLLILNKLKMVNGPAIFPKIGGVTDANEINLLGISRNSLLLFDYLTGPGSTYGIGKTTIRRYEDTRQAGIKFPNLTYDQILQKNRSIPNENNKINNNNDFENTFKLNIGKRGGSDSINLTQYSKIENDTNPWDDATPDLIKFGFECISNDNPSESTFLQFRALLNAGINDNNNANMNSFKYMGRGEEFFTYEGFQRTITFGFIVYAASKQEMRPIYNKLNYLVSQVYPDYSKSGIMRAPLVRVTIGDYLYRMPGFLENVSLNIDQTYSWEIEDSLQLPQAVGVTINFKPIFDEIPKRATLGEPITDNSNENFTITSNPATSIPKLLANREGIIAPLPPKISSNVKTPILPNSDSSFNPKPPVTTRSQQSVLDYFTDQPQFRKNFRQAYDNNRDFKSAYERDYRY